MRINRIRRILLVALCLSLTWVQDSGAVEKRRVRKKMGNLTLRKLRSNIPTAKSLKSKKVRKRNVSLVSPPSSNRFYLFDDNPLKSQYNQLVDEEIKRLYKLSKKFKKSRSRGEIWIRLADRYVEKAQIIDFKLQDTYDRKLKAFQAGKTKVKPRPPSRREVRDYHKRAIRLHEWYVRDFPKSKKVAQALYFLGYNNFEIGNLKKGEQYYKELTRRFPKSVYVSESHFALGEYYFEREKWRDALNEYLRIVQAKRGRLFTFALYKTAWCYFRIGKYKTALNSLEKVIKVSRGGSKQQSVEGTRAVDKLSLLKEAVGDYVNFYEQTGRYKQAYDDFMNVSRSEKRTIDMLDQLAYRYSYSGNLPASKYLFSQLISMNPDAPKAAKYQYQIVQDFGSTGRVKDFRRELSTWLDQFSRSSSWGQANKGKPKVIKDNFELQETTLRNHTLQLHNQALNARTKYSKKLAAGSYKMYLTYFKGAKNYSDMRFFYAELLYDLQDYAKAAEQYEWVVIKDRKSKYFKNSVENNVLAREKVLPSNAAMEQRRKGLKNKLKAIPLSPTVKKFERASLLYLKFFPKGDKALDIKRRLGAIYYAHNQFDPSIKVLRQIIKDNPKSKDARVAAEFILDIHRLRNNLTAYQEEGNRFLKNPAIANSKFGRDLRVNLQKAKFMVADNYSKSGSYLKAAKSFESFAASSPQSAQAFSALYNSAVNYDKTGSPTDAIRMYKLVLRKPSGRDGESLKLKQDARNSLAKVYNKMGRLGDAATYFEAYGRNEKGKTGRAAIYNAAILWDALNNYPKANSAYNFYAKEGRSREKQEVAWAKAEMLKRQKAYSKAIFAYDRFLKLNSPDLFRVIKARYNIASFYIKLGNNRKATEWMKKVRAIVIGSPKSRKIGARYGSQADYFLARPILQEMRRTRLGRREKSVTKGLEKMKQLQRELIKKMAKVIKYDYGPMIVAALAAEAESNEIIGTTFKKLPVPVEFAKGDMRKKFKELTNTQAQEFLGKAVVSYRSAFEKGIALKAYGPEMLLSAQALYRLDPKSFNHAGEINELGELLDMIGL